ncbi:MAG: ATPase [Oscillospiraceae bacterium]|jgi:V/A-type H+-transporting ATPase subunit I|nr:ATPase [Oscillospiraceae bacterium]
MEKMRLVNIAGILSRESDSFMEDSECVSLDEVLGRIVRSGCFHIENSRDSVENLGNFMTLPDDSSYETLLGRLKSILPANEIESLTANCVPDIGCCADSLEASAGFIDEIEIKLKEITGSISTLESSISRHEKELTQLKHLHGMNIGLERLFNISNIRIRFGKLPISSYQKLEYYDDKTFEFVHYDKDDSYYWGMYFTPVDSMPEVDNIMKSLYFERIWLPDFITGTPLEEAEKLETLLKDNKEQLDILKKEQSRILNENRQQLNKVYCQAAYRAYISGLKRYVSVFNGEFLKFFFIVGFIPENKSAEFESLFKDLEDVTVKLKSPTSEPRMPVPIKLKNSKFAEPFSMFVGMYGLPKYGGFNPTGFVSLTYTVLFGIMFGDLGQGLVLAVLGFLIGKKFKNPLGGILTRVGISSAFFGLIYGSVFGLEELLTPLYQLVGFEHKPFEVMQQINTIVYGSVALGGVIIVISIIINIIYRLLDKNYTEAVFGNNGIAGLVFFTGLVAGLISPILFDIKLLTPLYVTFVIILPVLAMFLREPLGAAMRKEKYKFHGIADFIVSNFFELFEFMLGYASNSLSFIRVGGFIFSHAGMMSVVMMLAESASGAVTPAAMIIGNIFVIVMEGLLVGIQVLRLVFYEMFSRFYEAEGRAFVSLKFNVNS